jgi:hypothetical protein
VAQQSPLRALQETIKQFALVTAAKRQGRPPRTSARISARDDYADRRKIICNMR